MNLYFRLLRILIASLFVKRQPLMSPSILWFRVWPSDCDLNFHMNNGRYLTLMDLGRIDLMLRNRLLPRAVRRGWRPVLGGCDITFRRELKPFRRFRLETHVESHDEKWFYIVQRFYREDDGLLSAEARVRGLFISKKQGKISSAELFALFPGEAAP